MSFLKEENNKIPRQGGGILIIYIVYTHHYHGWHETYQEDCLQLWSHFIRCLTTLHSVDVASKFSFKSKLVDTMTFNSIYYIQSIVTIQGKIYRNQYSKHPRILNIKIGNYHCRCFCLSYIYMYDGILWFESLLLTQLQHMWIKWWNPSLWI